jgi:hypothetical protein
MEILKQYPPEELREKGITYLTRTNGDLVYWDGEIIYFFEPIGIRKEPGFPFFDSNNCERYKLKEKFLSENLFASKLKREEVTDIRDIRDTPLSEKSIGLVDFVNVGLKP